MNHADTETKKVVVTLHGIRTHGKWQKNITPYLARHGIIPYHLDFGWFGMIRFGLPWTRNRRVQWIRNEFRDLKEKAGCSRVSVIAHSFGTYLIAAALEAENGVLLYDRVVLTGSIVRGEFDWAGVIAKRWVLAVRNERATRDRVVSLAAWVSRRLRFLGLKAGASGREPFAAPPSTVIDRCTEGGHSEVHNVDKFEQWARFIAYPNLPSDHLDRVVNELRRLRMVSAAFLDLDLGLIRANLFAPVGITLHIVPGAFDNMVYAPELGIEIDKGHGCTGAAFETGNVSSVWKTGSHWSGGHLPQQDRLDPRLKWVISVPIFSGRRTDAANRKEVLGVVNVDGLDTIPAAIQDPSSDLCKAIVLALLGAANGTFQRHLDEAYEGERFSGS